LSTPSYKHLQLHDCQDCATGCSYQ